jgi:hypothetical protein
MPIVEAEPALTEARPIFRLAVREALLPVCKSRSRASRRAFPSGAWERDTRGRRRDFRDGALACIFPPIVAMASAITTEVGYD